MRVNMINAVQLSNSNKKKYGNTASPVFQGRIGVRPVLAGNWKMNSPEIRGYFNELLSLISPTLGKWSSKTGGISKPEVIIFPPSINLESAQKALQGRKYIQIGAQNVHQAGAGAYTGEISVPMLKEKNINYSIIGHSERRGMFNETDKSVNAKVLAALGGNVKPIICCGESAQQQSLGKTNIVITKQIKAALKGVEKEDLHKLIIAYEPIWAIGTGKTCNSQDANNVMGVIRKIVANKYGQEEANKLRILYGGSANEKNAKELLNMPNIDGFLVGGASLKASQFSTMLSEMGKSNIL